MTSNTDLAEENDSQMYNREGGVTLPFKLTELTQRHSHRLHALNEEKKNQSHYYYALLLKSLLPTIKTLKTSLFTYPHEDQPTWDYY